MPVYNFTNPENKPIFRVELCHPKKSPKLGNGLFDTGADRSVFSKSYIAYYVHALLGTKEVVDLFAGKEVPVDVARLHEVTYLDLTVQQPIVYVADFTYTDVDGTQKTLPFDCLIGRDILANLAPTSPYLGGGFGGGFVGSADFTINFSKNGGTGQLSY